MGEQTQRHQEIQDNSHNQNRERDQRGKIMRFGVSRAVSVMASLPGIFQSEELRLLLRPNQLVQTRQLGCIQRVIVVRCCSCAPFTVNLACPEWI